MTWKAAPPDGRPPSERPKTGWLTDQSGRAPEPGSFDLAVLQVVTHRRFAGGHIATWRIREALTMPATPAVVLRALIRLERNGWIECRRARGSLEWRSTSSRPLDAGDRLIRREPAFAALIH